MSSVLIDLLIAASLYALLFAGLELGFRAGRRAGEEHDPRASGQIGAIQGAVLGLLGLLLGFSFAAAGSRFLERQDLIVLEANTIGTSYMRAGLLPEPQRTDLRRELKQYTADRLALVPHLRDGLTEQMKEQISASHARIWAIAQSGVLADRSVMLAVLPPINDLIDLHSTRISAGRKHLPMLVLGLLIACSLVAVAVIGYGCGLSGRRRLPMTSSLAILIGSALWITIDLDHPRAGLLQLSDVPLREIAFPEDE